MGHKQFFLLAPKRLLVREKDKPAVFTSINQLKVFRSEIMEQVKKYKKAFS